MYVQTVKSTKEKFCKHEVAIIYITYSTMMHDTGALFYISIVPLCEWKMIRREREKKKRSQEEEEEEEEKRTGGGGGV